MWLKDQRHKYYYKQILKLKRGAGNTNYGQM